MLGPTVSPADRKIIYEWFNRWRKKGIIPKPTDSNTEQWLRCFLLLQTEYHAAIEYRARKKEEAAKIVEFANILNLVKEVEIFNVPPTRHYSSYHDFQAAFFKLLKETTTDKHLKKEVQDLYQYHENHYTMPQLLLRLFTSATRHSLRTISNAIKKLNVGVWSDGHLFFSPTQTNFEPRQFIRLERRLTKRNKKRYARSSNKPGV